MAITWPGAVDSFSTKQDDIDIIEASHVNDLQSAVVALESAFGSEGETGLMELRMTLESGVPVSTSDQTAKTTLHITPYKGKRVAIYDGVSGWETFVTGQLSVSLSGKTANTNYDVFLYDNSGALDVELVAWSSGSARATALTTQDGVYVKSGQPTRRYIGTIRTTATTGQCEDSAANRFVYNYYNRVKRYLSNSSTSSHSYGTASWRAWNNDAANAVKFVQGVVEDVVSIAGNGELTVGGGTPTSNPGLGFGLNTTISFVFFILLGAAATANFYMLSSGSAELLPATGYNYIQMSEIGSTGSASTFASYNLRGGVLM